VYSALLEPGRAIPWKIDWASARFACVGLQVEDLYGVSQDSRATAHDA